MTLRIDPQFERRIEELTEETIERLALVDIDSDTARSILYGYMAGCFTAAGDLKRGQSE